jgi:N-methylhydantoinase B
MPGCTNDRPPPLVFTGSLPPGAIPPSATNEPPSPFLQNPRSSRNRIGRIGGRGLGTEAIDCFEEGFLLPACKLYAGGRRQQVLDLLEANVREPEAVLGDVHAQVAGNALGARRLQQMLTEFGLENLDGVADAVFARSEAGMRAAIAAIPDGTYRHEVELDGFEEPVVLRVQLVVRGSDLPVDYTGSSGPSKRGINVVLNYTRAYTTYGVKCVIAPDVPNNAGSFRPVTVTAPEGSILNAKRPAPVACRHLVGLSLPDAVIGALAQAVPGPGSGAGVQQCLGHRHAGTRSR